MLHSATSSKPTFSTFQLFVYQILNGNNVYKNSVDNIISEAYSLSKGDKNMYTVNRSYFALIYHLSTRFTEFLNTIDIQNIKNEEYQYLYDKMQNESELIMH
ncbi:hypothetical protein D1614_09880 [Maribellus luteus]|uniref:Uncharacterized protein n=1 Tax=Maribellus luteus TaxID=2305463 RepID=A0A399T206_9BACT|nr:hypothetical protein D1614_09880 [Maribellus luteus]